MNLSGNFSTANHSPDDFMFRQFRRHSTILTSVRRSEYFMLSAGANLFPMSDVWKELIKLEIDENLVYHWYTSQEGFPLLQRSVKFLEQFTTSEGKLTNTLLNYEVCMTLGASQAAAIVFDFVAHKFSNPKVLLLGYNYPLFERLAKYYSFQIRELVCYGNACTLPSPEAVEHDISMLRPSLLIITIPNNPSGEIYTISELQHILHSANRFGTLVLIDKVGELPISFDPWINIGKLVKNLECWSQVIIINSFSKTDSIPGFRIGYMLAASEIIHHATLYQLNSIMNPPTFPVLPVFFTLLARCFFLSEKNEWLPNDKSSLLHLFLRIFSVTTSVPPALVFNKVEALLSPEGFQDVYEAYTRDILSKANLIQSNKSYVLSVLNKYITQYTDLQAGFNFLVELEPFKGKEEDKICQDLFNDTALAILTESAFCINKRTERMNFWVRISLAAPENLFQRAINKLAEFLNSK